MDLEGIRAVCEGSKERECRNAELCKALSLVDEGFIYHIDRDIMNHSPEMSALDSIDAILNDECEAPEGTGKQKGTEWYNSYPFGVETDVIYSRFLGICRGKTKLDSVFKEAIRHSKDVVDCCSTYVEWSVYHQPHDRTTIILTDKWDVKTFAKYEKAFIRYACKHDIFPVFLLVTDYGYTQIPFLPNDRDKVRGMILDEDPDRVEARRMFNLLPVEYIEQGSVIDLIHRIEYTFRFDEKTWECKHPYDENGVIRGTIPDRAAKRFFNDVFWITVADDSDLHTDAKGIVCTGYSLSVFGKKLFWDASTIDENGDPRFIKLNKAIKLLISSLKKDG